MFVATFVFALVAGHVIAEIPSFIHVCGRQDPNIDECIVNSVKSMKGKLCSGIPELSVPPIEPVVIDKIVMSDTANHKLFLRDLVINGLCDFDVNSFHLDLEKNHFDIELSFKRIQINATYDFDIHIIVPIAQKGKIFITTDNVKSIAGMDMKIVTKDGKRYTYMSQMKINLDIKGYDAHYDLSERELGQLRQAVTSFIGSNQQDIIEAVKSPLEEVISKQILMLSNEIVKHFTYEELFPERATYLGHTVAKSGSVYMSRL